MFQIPFKVKPPFGYVKVAEAACVTDHLNILKF